MSSTASRAAVRLHLARLTPRQRAELVEAAEGSPEGIARLPPSPLSAPFHAVSERAVDAELARCERKRIAIVSRDDPGWPPGLLQLTDAPWALWVRGRLPDPARLTVALVGPRRPSPYGLAMVRRLASELTGLRFVIVSGGARGVDAEAHRAALIAGTPTVAVLGCGVDVAYPRDHAGLFVEIAAGGALVSEFPCGTPPLRHHFPVRNRLLAGWGNGVLIVEASFKSGSLITARLALEQNRDVFAVPGPVTSQLSEGTNDLLASGAVVLRGARDVVTGLRIDEQDLMLEGLVTSPPSAAPEADQVVAAMPEGRACSVDEMIESTGLGVGALLARLVALEATGRVQSLAGGLWMRGRRPP